DLPEWYAVCGNRHAHTYGFKTILALFGIKGDKAAISCVKKPPEERTTATMTLRKGMILITFAWTVEAVGVIAGFVTAAVTTRQLHRLYTYAVVICRRRPNGQIQHL